MAYLNREERHDTILHAAMRVAITEGMNATTVRRVASEAGVAVGQVHHHFTSVSQLRADAFLLLVKQSLAAFAINSQNLPAHERVLLVLGYPQDEAGKRETRLWNEVSVMAERDDLIKEACAISMSDWHQATVEVIDAGIANNEFRSDISASDIAWRLIGLVCGLDGLTQLTELGFSETEILRHLTATMKAELLKNP
ncbi:TetR family transcriptional regulator [Yersinia enterocolitica]|uniref:TetR family transcriptional regulator n=1 Tax=Yersinia enterocolitica TaxID=630 RepID=UPI0002819868|nr:TetR family transcriptional regulator [Yersinia enterocolitica]AJI85103.1 bacterial regulatory s, tetR family protein [Yersinia enterocolitica]EKA26994.1 TetR family transcriptional regulator [Yersinia enterocolitica subsp. enterocolitica WA-314]ELI8284569.1 TetR family transcriptional regulator [Yersinia enterocolitica]KGA72160.1 bacterial regulatory s, tetR family protein [Yersinia enterocolitica]KGA78285.1 bacterial regulatory s, tetR family protein [Yersinia enterocolitica]